MKTYLLLPLVALMTVPALSQPQLEPPRAVPARTLNLPGAAAGAPVPISDPTLTRFSLDFSGGTPKQLVTAIEKAMAKPLNAIIPEEHADVKLPPLKMTNVDVWQLFQALELTSQKTEAYVTGTAYGGLGRQQQNYQQMRTAYGFRTSGARSDDSIWYFYVEKPNMPPLTPSEVQKVCRFYPLTSYLERGLTVDDITTAIQTGWKMLGDKDAPAINFHKDTKLLIAVGDPAKLETIDSVLQALQPAPVGFAERLKEINTKATVAPTPAKPAE